MAIEVIAIGNEVLSGATVNTNAAFISHELTLLGYEVVRHMTLPDDPELLQAGLKEAMSRSKLIIATGGLGATFDDITQNTVSELFKKAPGQIPNKIGSAWGLNFENKLLILPGVPQEMRAMFHDQIIPWLLKTQPMSQQSFQESLHFCHLSEGHIDPILRELKQQFPEVKMGIYPTYGVASVRLKSENEAWLNSCAETLKTHFAAHLFPSQSGRIEEAIHELFLSEKLTLSFAESCTGGMMSEKITAMSGASHYFLGSIIAYSNQLKEKLLHVSSDTLKKGAVGKETVAEMLKGLFQVTGSDYGIAVSGIAGPLGATPEKPVGTIWTAMGKRGEPADVWTFKVKGNRETIILWATNYLLGALWRKIVYKQKGGS